MKFQFWAFFILWGVCLSCGSVSNNKHVENETDPPKPPTVDSLQLIDSLMTQAPSFVIKIREKGLLWPLSRF